MMFVWSGHDTIGGIVGVAKGPADAYAETQEKGGTIKPKKGKYLAVPLPAALTGAGVIKGDYNVSDLRTLKLICFRSKAGNLILAKKLDRAKRVRKFVVRNRQATYLDGRFDFIPLFVLKNEVTIPPHGYMEAGQKYLKSIVTDLIQGEINGVLAG
jgi:hypothetical protein